MGKSDKLKNNTKGIKDLRSKLARLLLHYRRPNYNLSLDQIQNDQIAFDNIGSFFSIQLSKMRDVSYKIQATVSSKKEGEIKWL